MEVRVLPAPPFTDTEGEPLAQKVFDRLYRTYGARNVLFMACRELTASRQCRSFYRQYVNYLATRGDVLDPEETARTAVRRAVDQFAPVVRGRWSRALPEVFE